MRRIRIDTEGATQNGRRGASSTKTVAAKHRERPGFNGQFACLHEHFIWEAASFVSLAPTSAALVLLKMGDAA